jgi:hypothetical protein
MIDCNIFTAFNCTTNSFGVKFFKRPPERLKMNTRGDFGGNQRLVETDIMPGERAWWLEWASLE